MWLWFVGRIADPLNGTNFSHNLWNTTFSTFSNLLGAWWLLVPISFVGIALFMKTREPVMVSMYLLTTGALLTTGGIFVGMMDMVPVFIIMTAAGLAGVLISLLFRR